MDRLLPAERLRDDYGLCVSASDHPADLQPDVDGQPELLLDVRAQEKKFAHAFRSAPYVLTLTRVSDGLIREVNEGFTNITGYDYDEAVGRTFFELGIWADESDRRSFVDALGKTGSVRDLEHQFRMRSGETILGAISADIIEIGGEKCILSSITDVTERRLDPDGSQRRPAPRQEIEVSCSVGIAIAPDDGRDEIELAKNADMAMYLAKQQGGDAVRLFGGASPSGKEV